MKRYVISGKYALFHSSNLWEIHKFSFSVLSDYVQFHSPQVSTLTAENAQNNTGSFPELLNNNFFKKKYACTQDNKK